MSLIKSNFELTFHRARLIIARHIFEMAHGESYLLPGLNEVLTLGRLDETCHQLSSKTTHSQDVLVNFCDSKYVIAGKTSNLSWQLLRKLRCDVMAALGPNRWKWDMFAIIRRLFYRSKTYSWTLFANTYSLNKRLNLFQRTTCLSVVSYPHHFYFTSLVTLNASQEEKKNIKITT